MRTLILISGLIVSTIAVATDDRDMIARYAYLIPGSSHAQRHPLQVTVTQVRFPQEVASVGEALNYLLARSGYRLDEQRSHWARAILMPQPLPEVHRDLGPIHLADALGVLAGGAWKLKVNPLYRTLIIEPTEEWRVQLEANPDNIEIEHAQPRRDARIDAYLEPAPSSIPDPEWGTPTDDMEDSYAVELEFGASLHDSAEIFVDDMILQQALDLLVPIGWQLRPEVRPTVLNTRISLISSTTWWDALTELARKLGMQTQTELLLHVFEEQKLVILEQS